MVLSERADARERKNPAAVRAERAFRILSDPDTGRPGKFTSNTSRYEGGGGRLAPSASGQQWGLRTLETAAPCFRPVDDG